MVEILRIGNRQMLGKIFSDKETENLKLETWKNLNSINSKSEGELLEFSYLLMTSHLWILATSAPRSWWSFSEDISCKTTTPLYHIFFVTLALGTSLLSIMFERIYKFFAVDLLREFRRIFIWILAKSALLISRERSTWLPKLSWLILILLLEHCLIHALFRILQPPLRTPLLSACCQSLISWITLFEHLAKIQIFFFW